MHNKPKAILTIGIPCSGKSTWAEKFCSENDYREINRDNLRMSLFNLEFYNDYKMNRFNESVVTDKVNELIQESAQNKQNIVISDTNLNQKFRVNLINKLRDLGYGVDFKVFDVEFFDALKRNDKRVDKFVPRSVMYNMYRRFMDYQEATLAWKKYKPNCKLSPAYIVDIDGTIATNDDSRGFFEWDKVGLDKPIHSVINIINMLYSSGNKIILLSGRDEVCFTETTEWCHKHGVKFDQLYMRPRGSFEKDRYVKLDLFNEHIRNQYNVLGVFDDRPQVALLWYDLGLTLFKVGDPILEF